MERKHHIITNIVEFYYKSHIKIPYVIKIQNFRKTEKVRKFSREEEKWGQQRFWNQSSIGLKRFNTETCKKTELCFQVSEKKFHIMLQYERKVAKRHFEGCK